MIHTQGGRLIQDDPIGRFADGIERDYFYPGFVSNPLSGFECRLGFRVIFQGFPSVHGQCNLPDKQDK